MTELTSRKDDESGRTDRQAVRRMKLLRQRAQQHQSQGDVGSALAALGELLEIAPRDKRALRRRAELLAEGGRTTDAISTLRAMAEVDVEDARVWRRLSEMVRVHGSLDDQIELRRRRVELGHAGADRELSRLEKAHRRREKAVRAESRNVDSPTGDQRDGHEERRTKLAPTRLAEATARASALLDAGDAGGALNLLIVEVGEEAARRKMGRLAKERARRSRADHTRGLGLLAAGDIEGAIETLGELMNAGERGAKGLDQIADLLLESGRTDEAIRLLMQLAEADPSDPGRWRKLTGILSEEARHEDEIAALKRRIELGFGDNATHMRIARLLDRLGRGSEAVEHREAAVAVSRDEAAGSMRSRRSANTLEEVQGYLAELEAALAGGDDTAQLRRQLYLANYRLRRASEAIVHFRAWATAEIGRGERPDVVNWRRLEFLLSQVGDTEGEIDVLRLRLRAGDDSAGLHDRLIRLLHRTGRAEQAGVSWAALSAYAAKDEVAARRLERLCAVLGPAPVAAPRIARTPSRTTGRIRDRTLVFPHAYKTAGTSLRRGLDRQFGPNVTKLGLTHGAEILAALGREDRAALDVVAGHFAFDDAEQGLVPLLLKAPAYIGVVRDPVARARSIYAFFSETYSDPLDLLQRLRVPYDPDVNVVVQRWMEDEDWNGWRGDQCRGICGEASAERAIATIEAHYLLVVTPKGINPFLEQLARLQGMPWAGPVHLRSSSSSEVVIAPGLEARLRTWYEEDQKLVDWVAANEERMTARALERLEAWLVTAA